MGMPIGSGPGGWGDPLERDPEAVLRDVRGGRLSRDHVRREYAVVIRPDLTLDREATEAERSGRRTTPAASTAGAAPEVG